MPTTPRPRFIADRLADTPSPLFTNPPPAIPPANPLTNHRDGNGRFTKGCRPGPGRPRKSVPHRFLDPLHVLNRSLDMENTFNIWGVVVNRCGVTGARDLLKNLESEYGPICFRQQALQAITEAEQKLRAPKSFTGSKPVTAAASPKSKLPSSRRRSSSSDKSNGRPTRTK